MIHQSVLVKQSTIRMINFFIFINRTGSRIVFFSTFVAEWMLHSIQRTGTSLPKKIELSVFQTFVV